MFRPTGESPAPARVFTSVSCSTGNLANTAFTHMHTYGPLRVALPMLLLDTPGQRSYEGIRPVFIFGNPSRSSATTIYILYPDSNVVTLRTGPYRRWSRSEHRNSWLKRSIIWAACSTAAASSSHGGSQ